MTEEEARTKSALLQSKGYWSDRIPVHTGSVLMLGKQLVRALNYRIVIQKTLVDFYKARITQMKVGKPNDSTIRKIQTLEVLLIKENEAMKYYQDLRDRFYYQVDLLLEGKTVAYKEMFKSIILEGMNAVEIKKKLKLTASQYEVTINQIAKDMFDDEYKEDKGNAIYIQGRRRSKGKDATEGHYEGRVREGVHAEGTGAERELDTAGIPAEGGEGEVCGVRSESDKGGNLLLQADAEGNAEEEEGGGARNEAEADDQTGSGQRGEDGA